MQLDREGVFKAKIVGYGIRETQSASRGIEIDCLCFAEFNPADKTWAELPAPHPETKGTIWIIGKEGDWLARAAEEFEYASGWDGTFEQLTPESQWSPNDVEITVEFSSYKGVERFDIAMGGVRKITEGPQTGAKPMPPSKLERLKAEMEAAKNKKKAPPDSSTTDTGVPF